MRFFLLTLASLICSACSTTRGNSVDYIAEIVEIIPRYMDTGDFKHISEYMTGKENPGKRVIVRTRPKQRDGFYFVLILNQNIRKLPPDAYIVSEFYTSKSLDLQTHRFEFPSILPSTREIFVGLTGEDSPSETSIPSAWRFTIKNSEDEILAQKQSYLWSL